MAIRSASSVAALGVISTLLIVLSCVALSVAAAKYDTSFKGYSDTKINLHLTCHTHDDVGWLKTVDQYFYGANNSIQHAGVQYILDSVIPALQANPDRHFVYIEQAFFQRWWHEQTELTQAAAKDLFNAGQLHFANGGWCMHDEANTHYVAMVDQTTVGHTFLLNEFGSTPTVGWQIDPFGHSATQAALLSAEVGFNSLFFGRIDYQDREKRLKEHEMEMVWRASPSLGAAAQIFTGAFQSGNYGPPSGYCFDQDCNDPPMQTDTTLEDYNVQSRVEGFVQAALEHYSHSPDTGHIMFKMGSDFQYENANEWFSNLDKLIHYTNLDGRINVFYSDPDQYTRAVNAANKTWTVKTDDFFPYADCPHCYWTGYFTSRPALKGYIREMDSYLQVCKQLSAWVGGDGTSLQGFMQDMGVAQHHDAVAGTEKQHVAYDYAKRISKGQAAGETVTNDALGALTAKSSAPVLDDTQFTQCRLLNESKCDASQSLESFVMVVYNQNSVESTRMIRIPVNTTKVAVYNQTGDSVNSQITMNKFSKHGGSPYTLVFEAALPATGFATFFVQPGSTPVSAPAQDAFIESDVYKLQFDEISGRLTFLENRESAIGNTLTQEWMYWNSSASGNGWGNTESKQNSGAYIFRPNGTAAFKVNTDDVQATATVGPLVSELTQVWSDWVHSVTRLYKGANYVETEYTIGPVPFAGDLGKEVVSRYSTNISSAATYYTDSNGRELQKRVKDFRPTWTLNLTEPVSSNFYPVNALIHINDSSTQLTVLTDRSQGGASLADGDLELMVHRRIMFDDGRGVGEPLNETTSCTPYPNFRRLGTGLVITGKHYLQLETTDSAASKFRPLQQDVYSNPIIAFAPLKTSVADYAESHVLQASLLTKALPINVNLMTLEPRGSGKVLLRLAHLFGINEDPVLSKPATVDLATLFTDLKISTVTEMSLTANQPLSKIDRLKWNTVDNVQAAPREIHATGPPSSITLTAMQIRTFMLDISAR